MTATRRRMPGDGQRDGMSYGLLLFLQKTGIQREKSLSVVDKGWHDVWFGSAMSNCCPCRTFLAKQEQRRVPHSQVFVGVSEGRLETFVFRLTFVSKPEK